MQTRKTTTAVLMALAVPCLAMLGGCNPFGDATWGFGEEPRSVAIFCDYELRRTCATQADVAMGIDMAKRDEHGLWVGRSSTYGLDYSPEATAQCGGMPLKVDFAGPFPDGKALCFNPGRFNGVGVDWKFDSVVHACRDTTHCVDFDKDKGCATKIPGTPSHRIGDAPFLNACTAAGTLLPDWKDPRKIAPLKAVIWMNVLGGLAVNGNSLKKTSPTPAFDAGAAAAMTLAGGADGIFDFTATETNTARTAGFAKGALPDVDPSDADIFYAVALQPGGVLTVRENLQTLATTTYAPNDRIRVAVLAGLVYFFKNDEPLAIGSSPTGNAVLRVSVSLRDVNATITDAATTF